MITMIKTNRFANTKITSYLSKTGFYFLAALLIISLAALTPAFASSISTINTSISDGETSASEQTASSSALETQAVKDRDKYEMALLADLHICESNLKSVIEVIAAINGMSVDSTALLGDICKEIATGKEFDLAIATVKKLKTKIFSVTGNHDCIYDDRKNGDKKIRASAAVKKHKLDRFREAFGQKSNYFSRKANGYLLIFLSADALNAKHLVTLSSDALNWLEKTLDDNKKMPAVIFCHAPLENSFKASDKLGMAHSCAQPANKIEDILKKNKQVFLWVSGHVHARPSGKNFDAPSNFWKDQVRVIHNPNVNKDAKYFNRLTLGPKYALVRTYDASKNKWLAKFDRKIGLDGKLIKDDDNGANNKNDDDEINHKDDDDDDDIDKDARDNDNDNNNDAKKDEADGPIDLKGVVTPGLGEVKVRDGAWGKVIGTLFAGKFIDIKSSEGDWYIIDYKGQKGYILKQALLTNSAGTDDKFKKLNLTAAVDVNPAYGLNVRDGAWGDKIGKLGDKDKIEITGEEGDWYKINYNGKTGFVYKSYIKVSAKNKNAGDNTQTKTAAKDTNAQKPAPAAAGNKAPAEDNTANPAATPAQTALNGTKGFESNGRLNVPERAQRAPENGKIGHSLCGPTSLAMAMDFYGVTKPTVKVSKETKTLSASGGWQGTYIGNILTAAKSNGFKGSYMKENLSIDSLKNITAAGKPVIVNVNTQGYWGKGHYMVVTGVKDGKVFVNDPWQGGERSYSFSAFKAQWATRNERAIVVQP